MRNGLRSSRGAMRGTIGGTVGLATVAIGFRSFRVRALCATSLDCGRVPCVHPFHSFVHLARQQPQTVKLVLPISRSRSSFPRLRGLPASTYRGTASSKNGSVRHSDAAESPEPRPRAPRRSDRAPAGVTSQPCLAAAKSLLPADLPTPNSERRLAPSTPPASLEARRSRKRR